MTPVAWNQLPPAHAVVAAVAHRQYLDMDAKALCERLHPGGLMVDVKACFDEAALRAEGLRVWRL